MAKYCYNIGIFLIELCRSESIVGQLWLHFDESYPSIGSKFITFGESPMKPDYEKVRAGMVAMMQRFLAAKKKAEREGTVRHLEL